MNRVYLGDGIYASFDGRELTLHFQGESATLPPALWYALLAWMKDQRARQAA